MGIHKIRSADPVYELFNKRKDQTLGAYVSGLFDNVKKDKISSPMTKECLAAINRASVDTFLRAFEVTIYGGTGGFMLGDANVQQARAEVQRL